jgi:hypothetical protein
VVGSGAKQHRGCGGRSRGRHLRPVHVHQCARGRRGEGDGVSLATFCELYIDIRELPQLRISVGHTYISSDAVAIVKMARPCYKSSARRDRHSGTGVRRSLVPNAQQYIRGPWAATHDRGASDR